MNDKRSKRIVVHLGPPKTGTTTIQAFLYRARDALVQGGVRYSDAARIRENQTRTVHRPGGIKRVSGPATAQHLLPWAMLGEVDSVAADDVWQALLTEIAACHEGTVVLSSEAFSRLGREHVDIVRRHLEPYAVMPVAYVRNPLSRLLSDYTQRVKRGRCDESFSEFLKSERRLLENYDGFVDIWDAAFGPDTVVLRSFDAAIAGDGLETDFASLITTEVEALRHFRRSARLNESPGTATVRMQRRINLVETRLGRPAMLRRAFDAARRITTLKGAVGLQRRLSSNTKLESPDDVALVEALSSARYRNLLARCDNSDPKALRHVG